MQSEAPPSIKLFAFTALWPTQQQTEKEAVLCEETPCHGTVVEREHRCKVAKGQTLLQYIYLILSLGRAVPGEDEEAAVWNETRPWILHPMENQCYCWCLTKASNSGEQLTAQPASISSCQIYLKLWVCLCKKCHFWEQEGVALAQKAIEFPRWSPYILATISIFYILHAFDNLLRNNQVGLRVGDNIPPVLCMLRSATSSCICG